MKKSKFLGIFSKNFRFFSPLFRKFFGVYLVNFKIKIFENLRKNLEPFSILKFYQIKPKNFRKKWRKKSIFLENFSKISIFFTHFPIIFLIFKNIFFDRKFRKKSSFFARNLRFFLLEKNFDRKFRNFFFKFFFRKTF